MARTIGAWAATLSLLFTWQGIADAQSTTFRSGIELVNLNVSVVAANQRPVDGLTEEQFQIFEDGVLQRVEFFAPGELPIDVGILLDISGSMYESLPLVQQAARRFVASLRPVDRGTVLTISSGLRVLQPLTDDRTSLERAVDSVTANGSTPLYACIYAALTELARARRTGDGAPRRAALVVLSDGIDTSSGLTFDDLQAIVRRHAIPIYTIAPRRTKGERLLRESAFGELTSRSDFELRTLAADTGGQSFFPSAVGELALVYDSIANELAHQYSLGYLSSNGTADGKFRRILVRVLAPGLRWRARSGYLAGRATQTFSEPQTAENTRY